MDSSQTPAPPGAEPGVRPETDRRSGRSPRDMAMSLGVLLLPILLVFFGYRVVFDGAQPVTADPAPAVAQARAAAGFPVTEPSGLGPQWRTVSARFERAEGGDTLRLGYVGPHGATLQVVQSDLPAERLLTSELTERRRAQAQVTVEGLTWRWYEARPGERALVRTTPQVTVIVVGTAREIELRDLATALA